MELIAKTFMGLEDILVQELTDLGAEDIVKGCRVVSFKGDKALMYRANFSLRTAIRILKPIKTFGAKSADDVYDAVKEIDWSEYIAEGKTFTVDPISKRRLENLGEEDRYFIKDHHIPIISHETFEKAQEIRNKRNGGRKHHVEIGKREKYSRQFAFSSMLECGFCGTNLSRRRWHSSSKYKKSIWQCCKSTKEGKRFCPDSKGIPEEIIEEAFIESYRLLCSDNRGVMEEFLKRIEKTLGDDTIQKNLERARKDASMYTGKRKKLLDKYVEGGIEKEVYESTDMEYQQKLSEANAQIEYYEGELYDENSLRRRIESFKKSLSENQVLEEFDRGVFESIVEKVIVGGYDEDGNKDPYRITFIYKTGFKDSIDNAKAKFKNKGSKDDSKLCPNHSVQDENLCSDNSADTRRDCLSTNTYLT